MIEHPRTVTQLFGACYPNAVEKRLRSEAGEFLRRDTVGMRDFGLVLV
jgi:hypothetical protein